MSDTNYRGYRVIVQQSISGSGWYAMLIKDGPRTNDTYYPTAEEALSVAKKEIDRELDPAGEMTMNEETKIETETTPKGAALPSRKTTREEMEIFGWEFLRDSKKGKIFMHRETKEFGKISHHGFAETIE